MSRFSDAARDAAATAPRGISSAEGWWIVALAVVLGVSHAFVYQSHAFEWGGILRAVVLFLMSFGVAWVALQRRAAERVHPTGHGRALMAALGWAFLVVVVAGWLWIVPAEGHRVGWVPTTVVAALGVLPLALVGLRLARAGSHGT